MAAEPGKSASGLDGLSWGDALDESDRLEVRPPPPGRLVLQVPSLEALFWALFSAGGFVAAILLPAHVAILGMAYGAGWLPRNALSYERVLSLARNPITKLYLLALMSLPLYHWAHRFRFAIHHQFGIGLKRLVAVGCYGTAIAGTVLAAVVLLRM
jgi:fumarate reductase subunit D